MANPDWWLQKALIGYQSMSGAAADAGLDLRDLACGVTGGTEDAPDYVLTALDTTSAIAAGTAGSSLDDTGFQTLRDGFIGELQ